ncbi:MAG TPA: hypothetical protein VM689_22150 [Aliidongia sp.]|nr:hypothetical protein [Aliidongia sp.]
MLRAFAVAVVLAAISRTCAAASPPAPATQIRPQGETKISASFGKVALEANLLTHQVGIGSPSAPAIRRTSNCTYSHDPCMLVDSLEISVNGRQIAVPRSAFGDLSDLWTVAFHKTGSHRFTFVMIGGDASEAYKATLTFDGKRVLQRSIIDSEAGAVAERTVYFDLSHYFQ